MKLGSGGMYNVYICVCREEIKSYIGKGRKRYRCRPQATPRHRCFATAHSVCAMNPSPKPAIPHIQHISLSPGPTKPTTSAF